MDFLALKPLCDNLANNPNVQNAISLGNHISQQTTATVQYHLEYILLPIYVHLCNDELSKDEKQHLIQLLQILLSKARITRINCFQKLYNVLLLQIYDPHQTNMLITSHEELKETTVKCLNALFKNSCSNVLESLYNGSNAAKLSHGVYLCLGIARTEKSCSLRVAAIETLMTLSYVHSGADCNDISLKNQVADIFMFFLPGIASGLCQIALGGELQNHRITMMSIKAYGRILSLVMEDSVLAEDATIDSMPRIGNTQDDTQDPLGMRLKLEGSEGMKKYIQSAKRNREWFEAASTKLNASLRSLINVVKHAHCQVRKELVLAVKLMLSKCSRNMTPNLTILVEILISLSEDEEETVKNLAKVALDDINIKLMRDDNMRPIVHIFEENFYKLLTKLPRLIRRSDDSIQCLYLNQLAGYIRLLGKERMPNVMASSSHLKRLVLALVYVIELDSSRVLLLEDIQIRDIEDFTYSNSDSWKSFKFIREAITEENLISVCKLLGELGDQVLLADCIFDLIAEMSQYQKELTLLLNWISAVPVKDPAMSNFHKQIIDCYTDPENWYLPIQVGDNVTFREAQSNVVYSCIQTEGLGIIAKNLREQYDKYLLKTLYLVIERAGSGNSLLRQVGLKTLEDIAHAQNYTNVADLLRDNVDYISYHMTMKMQRFEKHPGVLDVFSVVMKYSTMEHFQCPKEVVDVALRQLSAKSHLRNTYALLKVLYVFVICIRKLVKDTEQADGDDKGQSKTVSNTAEIVIQSLLEYYNAKKDSEQLEDEIVTTPDDIEAESENGTAAQFSAYDNQDDEEKEPPSHIKMTESVIKCCLHFFPSKEVSMSLLAMQITEEGLYILSDFNNQLLPIVHELWHPLVDRFRDSNILVVNRAWQLLYTLAHVSQDFIRSRTLKQILPCISKFLTTSAKESYKKDAKNAHKFTQMFKLQKLILSQAATIARNIKLQEEQLWKILDVAQPYLDTNQHHELQESCVNLFKDIAVFHGDIVWVKCLDIWHSHIAKIPVDSKFTLEHLQVTATGAHNDYQTNVERILSFVEELTAGYM